MRQQFALLPFLIFIAVFIGLNSFNPYASPEIKADFPIFATFIAIIFSFFTFKAGHSLNEKINIFMQGASQTTVLHMCFIFLFSTMLSHTVEEFGGGQAAVDLALYFIPSHFMLPGIFLVSCIFSLWVGTSMGTIITFMPIFYRLSTLLQITPELTAGVVVSGAMFGDNLSFISDTTIAANKVTDANMFDKLRDNLRSAIPAALIVLAILTYLNKSYITVQIPAFMPQVSMINILKIIPFLMTFVLSFFAFDTLFAFVISIFIAIGIGLYLGQITFLSSLSFFHDGFYKSKGMVSIFILVLFLSGLSHVVKYNGGINYLLSLLGKESKSLRKTKIEIFLLVFLVNAAIAINTISILITGPIATQLGKNKLSNARIASILDIGSCVSQGILPYTPQLLLAATLCNTSPLAIMPYLLYPYALLITLTTDILIRQR